MPSPNNARVLITGGDGFIGRNLAVRLAERPGYDIQKFGRSNAMEALPAMVDRADVVVHLAGENRPRDPADFERVNVGLTRALCGAIAATGRTVKLIFASSIHATAESPYGKSKRQAEREIELLADKAGVPAVIYRLQNVFGKWCRPNYNSVVATFCHNLANGLPIRINDPFARLQLVYIDDVVSEVVAAIGRPGSGLEWGAVTPQYSTTLGKLAAQIEAFADCRTSLISEQVGAGLVRALYATYVSYLPTAKFAYELPVHGDARGVFVEMLKTKDSGQFSFFTAHPGVTRGGHYHHTKSEKFLVIKGRALFRFRQIVTGETYELSTSGEQPMVVETVPGWTHDITNIGEDELIAMLWANEVFDRARPDTIACKV